MASAYPFTSLLEVSRRVTDCIVADSNEIGFSKPLIVNENWPPAATDPELNAVIVAVTVLVEEDIPQDTVVTLSPAVQDKLVLEAGN